MCDKVVFREAFTLKYCLDRYNTKETCDKAVDACLPTALKFFADCFVTNKLLENFYNV